MELISLSSGSKGNCFYANINGVSFLIDVGLSMKKINEKLEIATGYDLENIDIIVITHRHDDHVKSLHTILNKYEHIKVLSHESVFNEYLEHFKHYIHPSRKIVIDKVFEGKNVKVKAYELNHDVSCYGYLFIDKSNNETFMFFADNGGISYKKYDDFKGFTYYAIESNHDKTLEVNHPTRALLTKRRSLSYKGHNDNYSAIELAVNVITSNTKGIIFHHLSEDCNSVELASETHNNYRHIWGEVLDTRHVNMVYATQHDIVVLV